MIPQLADQLGQAAVYAVKGSGGDPLVVVRELMIVLFGIEAGMAGGGRDAYWLQLQATKADGTVLTASVLVDDPILAPTHTGRTRVLRYIYQEGDQQPIEYVDAIRHRAVTTVFGLLPNFFPIFDAGEAEETLFPARGTYLGLPIEKQEARRVSAGLPGDILRLELDPELIIGTGRNVRDVEGKRIWTGDDYQYRGFEEADYKEMIEAGINYFRVSEDQEQWVIREPVFFLRRLGKKIPYPELFYRANWRGMTMFMDEPAIHLAWFTHAHPGLAKSLDGPSAVARMLEQVVRETYKGADYGRMRLHNYLARWFDLGCLVIDEDHYPAWETQQWSTYYQLKAGLPGLVHEGRYTNHADVLALNAEFDARIPDTPENVFKICYAWFRGAARSFDGDWGTAIYGQCEQSLAPMAMTMAYDSGARYVWFWTSDRLHHMPYPEQLQLTRHLRAHARQHSRQPLEELRQVARAAIVLPDGYPMAVYALWGTHVFHLDRVNRYGLKYRDVLHPAALQVERYIKENIAFDFLYDDGHPAWQEYDEAVVIGENGKVQWFKKGKPAGLPPDPERSAAERAIEPPTIAITDITPEDAEPLTIKLSAEIGNVDGPVGLRSRDWGTPDWTQMEAFWTVYEDPDEPRFFPVGRSVDYTFKNPGTYKVTVWTCNVHGMAARDEAEITVSR